MGVSGDELRYLKNNKIDPLQFYMTLCMQAPDEIYMADCGGNQPTVVVQRCREIMCKMIWKKYPYKIINFIQPKFTL